MPTTKEASRTPRLKSRAAEPARNSPCSAVRKSSGSPTRSNTDRKGRNGSGSVVTWPVASIVTTTSFADSRSGTGSAVPVSRSGFHDVVMAASIRAARSRSPPDAR